MNAAIGGFSKTIKYPPFQTQPSDKSHNHINQGQSEIALFFVGCKYHKSAYLFMGLMPQHMG